MPAKSKSTAPENAAPAPENALSLAPQDDHPGVKETVPNLIVRARVDGFRRAGRSWPAAGCVVSPDAFSTDELDALLSEPMLIVVRAEGKVQ